MMDCLRQSALRFLAHFRAPALDSDLDAEMASHLQFAIEDNLPRGLPSADARRQALIQSGGPQQSRENHREARSFQTLDDLLKYLRFAFRSLRKDRSFTIIAILILDLAIGANVAVFSVVNTLLLQPLPFPNSQELVWIAPPPSSCGFSCATYSADAFEEFRSQSLAYQDVTGYEAFTTPDNLRPTGHGDPVPAIGIEVIGNFSVAIFAGYLPALRATRIHPAVAIRCE